LAALAVGKVNGMSSSGSLALEIFGTADRLLACGEESWRRFARL
jgi:hypothetical protein